MPYREPTASPLIRALIRTLLALACTSGVLSASAVPQASACGDPGAPARQYRPLLINCDYLTHLELDFLNDDAEAPAAFNRNAGAITFGEAAEFHVYAATDDPRFFEDISSRVEEIKFRVRGGGARGRPFRVRYRDDGDNPRWVFEPTRPRIVRRTVSLDCSFSCKRPNVTYTTRFILSLLPADKQPAN